MASNRLPVLLENQAFEQEFTVVELVPGGLDVSFVNWKYEVGSFLNDRGESLRVQWDLLGGRVELTQTFFPLLWHLMATIDRGFTRGLNFSCWSAVF